MSAICVPEVGAELLCSAAMPILVLLLGRLSIQLCVEQLPAVRVPSDGCDERSLTFGEQQKLPLENKPLRHTRT
jgi:hypothetical protein